MWKGWYFPIIGGGDGLSIRFDQYVWGKLIEVWCIGGPVPADGAFTRESPISYETLQAFWHVVEAFAWRWSGQDYGAYVADGGPWVLEVRRGERTACVRGNGLDIAPKGFRRVAYALYGATGGSFMKKQFEGPASEIELSFPSIGHGYPELNRLLEGLIGAVGMSEGFPTYSESFIGPKRWGLRFRCNDPTVCLETIQEGLKALGLWGTLCARHRQVWEDDWQELGR
jgi:hypothetical protein